MLQTQFLRPVHDAQQTFRSLLTAMAEPLQPRPLPVLPPACPPELLPATAATLLTLLDGDVSLYARLSPAGADWLRFHTGVQLCASAGEADYVLVTLGQPLPALSTLKQGDPAYPDRAATLLLETERFNQQQVSGQGPGLASSQPFGASALTPAFWQQWQQQTPRFPLGVDVFVISTEAVAALPRSCRITEL